MMGVSNDWQYRRAKATLRNASTRRQAARLAGAISDYQALRMAGGLCVEFTSLEDLSRAIIKARIARGWTQQRLAEALGMPKQQVQRYEATEYRSASLRRLLQVSEALDLRVQGVFRSVGFSEEASELAKSLAGHAAAEAVQAVERRVWLRSMTADQARRLFDDLCATYYRLAPLHQSAAEGVEGLAHRLAVQEAFDTLARRWGAP